jgi:hypothetical protein
VQEMREIVSDRAEPAPTDAGDCLPVPVPAQPEHLPAINRAFMSGTSAVATMATAGIGLHLLLRFIFHVSPFVAVAPLYVVMVLGGVPLLIGLARRLLHREFGSDL